MKLLSKKKIKMGDGEAPVVEEFKYLGHGSMLSKNFDDSVPVTIMARIRLARIAFTKLEKAFESLEEDCLRVARALAAFVWLGMQTE